MSNEVMIFHVISHFHLEGGVGRYTKLLEELRPKEHKVVIVDESSVISELTRILDEGHRVWIHSIFESLVHFDFNGGVKVWFCMHAPVLTCVGGERYLQTSKTICDREISRFGCYLSGLKEKCCSRHPRKFVNQLSVIEKIASIPSPNCQFVAFSRFTYTDFVQRYPLLKSRTQHLSLFGQDLRDLQPSTPQLKSHKVRLLFVGRIISHKGVHLLMQSWMDLVRKGFSVELTIVGPEAHPSYQDFFSLEQQIGSEDVLQNQYRRISWLAPNDLAGVMNASDLLVVPSIYPEAFGLVGVEAMSLGLPAMAFNVGGISEWCRHGQTGFLVEEVSVHSLRLALENVISNPEVIDQLGSECRSVYESHFTAAVHLASIKKMMKHG